jgi:arylsulfatase A-like enzyme
MVSSYDLFPSILDYLGYSAPPDRQRVGRSYVPMLRGERLAPRGEVIFEYCYTRAIRTENWKYVQRAEEWWDELYDLEKDPGENVNLIGWPHNRKQLTELRTRLNGLFARAGAPPIEKWRTTNRQILPIDSGYYDNWLTPRTAEER